MKPLATPFVSARILPRSPLRPPRQTFEVDMIPRQPSALTLAACLPDGYRWLGADDARGRRRIRRRVGTAQVFCTTMFGNFEVMSRARSAMWIATLRAI